MHHGIFYLASLIDFDKNKKHLLWGMIEEEEEEPLASEMEPPATAPGWAPPPCAQCGIYSPRKINMSNLTPSYGRGGDIQHKIAVVKVRA